MKTFAELFKKYRLRAEFETFASFGKALAEKGFYYEESIFSHWQKGTRVPSNRKLILTILELFKERNALNSPKEANDILSSVGMGYMTEGENLKIFNGEIGSHINNNNFIIQLNKLIFVSLAVVGGILFSIYSFIDIQNTLVFLAFCINFTLSVFLYFQSSKIPALFSFFITAFGISAWCLAMIFYRASPPEVEIVAAKLLYSLPLVIPTAFLLFGLYFPNEKISRTTIYFFMVVTLIFFILTLMKNAVIVDVISIPGKEKVIIFGWAYYYVYFFYYPVLFILGYYVFFRKCLKAEKYRKMQLLFILSGMSAASIPSLITNLFLPTIGNFEFNWIGQLFTVFWIGGVFFAISKYSLLNITPFRRY